MSPSRMSIDDLAAADEPILNLIIEQSEKRLAAQVAFFISGDARSVGLLAGAAALAAAGMAIAAGEMKPHGDAPVLVGAGVFAISCALAALLAVWSLWPTDIEVLGWSPSKWTEDIQTSRSIRDMKADMALEMDDRILDNRSCNLSIVGRARAAMLLLVAAPFAGGCVAAIAWWLHLTLG